MIASSRLISIVSRLAVALLLCTLCHRVVSGEEDQRCQEWAEAGECTQNQEYMAAYCASSCAAVEKEQQQRHELLSNVHSFYDLSCRDIDGHPVDFHDFRGKVVVIVNVASQCGYTASHYRGLVQLWDAVASSSHSGEEGNNNNSQKVEILAFPCNQFGKQEPGTANEIKLFAQGKGVQFRMMEKIDVNGGNAHLIYVYLKEQAGIDRITWNFATYFVLSPTGDVESFTGVEPMDLVDTIRSLQENEEL